jgi:hypothetical protein
MCATFSAAAVAGRGVVLAVCLLTATPALAQDAPTPLPQLGDVMHKGLVGKALDVVPMDPDERVILQRTSAVVNGTLTGRSLAIWAGLGHPVLMAAGLIWGIYSALNIHATAVREQNKERLQPSEPVEASLLVARARED